MREAYSRYKNCTQEEALFLEAMRVQRWDSDPRFREKEFIAKGEKRGLRKGLKLGEEKGAHNAKLDMAKSALAKGFDVQTIVELTGLTKEEILTLEK